MMMTEQPVDNFIQVKQWIRTHILLTGFAVVIAVFAVIVAVQSLFGIDSRLVGRWELTGGMEEGFIYVGRDHKCSFGYPGDPTLSQTNVSCTTSTETFSNGETEPVLILHAQRPDGSTGDLPFGYSFTDANSVTFYTGGNAIGTYFRVP